jgi:hypothetical protein
MNPLTKKETEAAIAAAKLMPPGHGFDFFWDVQNSDPNYAERRLRHRGKKFG